MSGKYFLTRLKNLRLRRELKQQEVAEYLCVTRECYANYECGRREMGYEQLVALAELFGVSIDYLLGRHNSLHESLSEQEINEFFCWKQSRKREENYLDLNELLPEYQVFIQKLFKECKDSKKNADGLKQLIQLVSRKKLTNNFLKIEMLEKDKNKNGIKP